MIYVYDEMTHEVRSKSAQAQKKISETTSKLGKLEERFATGEIERTIYTKYSEKYHSEIEELKAEINFPEFKSSNLENEINLALNMSSNLNELWDSGNLEQKQQLQKLVFPFGLGYDKQSDKVQTPETNEFIRLTSTLSMNLAGIKNGDSISNDQISAFVTPEGFKPPTLRAEI